MIQKKFMDIERVKFGDGISTPNTLGFEVGNHIQISEKWDGSNACVAYDSDTGKLVAFSRKRELSFEQTLNGFWNYVQNLNPDDYADTPTYRIFGEWGNKNAITYSPEFYKRWYVYDIYDIEKEQYLPQSIVKDFCDTHNLEYIHVLYDGDFISWEHCMTFCNSPAYGDKQEGVVVKNQSKLNDPNCRQPFYLKIVNASFSEIKKDNHIRKVEDPQKLKQREYAQSIVDKIVTSRRVEKEIHKMIDEGILPKQIEPKDMRIISQNIPKRIYNDCLKEEPEYVKEAGELFGKLCGNQAMKFAREIIIGNE